MDIRSCCYSSENFTRLWVPESQFYGLIRCMCVHVFSFVCVCVRRVQASWIKFGGSLSEVLQLLREGGREGGRVEASWIKFGDCFELNKLWNYSSISTWFNLIFRYNFKFSNDFDANLFWIPYLTPFTGSQFGTKQYHFFYYLGIPP